MFKDLPELAYRDTYVFRGSLVQDGGPPYPIESLNVSISKYQHPSEYAFSFQCPHEGQGRVFHTVGWREPRPFEGTLEYSGQGKLLDPPSSRLLLSFRSSTADRVEGVVEKMEIRVETLSRAPAAQTVVAWLTQTEFALPEAQTFLHYPDGIERPFGSVIARAPFEIPTRLGTFRLCQSYRLERARSAGEEAEVLIPTASMSVVVRSNARTQQIGDLMDQVSTELQIPELLLSFVNRRHVHCHRIAVYSDLGEDPGLIESNRYSRSFSTARPHELLLAPWKIEKGGLGELCRQTADSPHRDTIERTIAQLIAFWSGEYIENRIVAGFTAFETLINGMSTERGSHYILDTETFENLSRALKKTIRAFGIEVGTPAETRAQLYEKLAELRRPSFPRQAASLLTEYSVSWCDLWDGGGGSEEHLMKKLRLAYGRRSDFIHAGRIADYAELWRDAAFVNALAERLICRLISVDLETVNPYAFYYARR